jgi:hypothetical protein
MSSDNPPPLEEAFKKTKFSSGNGLDIDLGNGYARRNSKKVSLKQSPKSNILGELARLVENFESVMGEEGRTELVSNKHHLNSRKYFSKFLKSKKKSKLAAAKFLNFGLRRIFRNVQIDVFRTIKQRASLLA